MLLVGEGEVRVRARRSGEGMGSLTVQEILKATGGTLRAGSEEEVISSFSTDTRTLRPGDFFIALGGKNFDGHAFLSEAIAKKATGLLVSDTASLPSPPPLLTLAVPDTLFALGQIARAWRLKLSATVVAITGSNGKTTTKEMTRAVLQEAGAVWASPGNLNNLIGLPLTLFGLRPSHGWAVVELGMNAPGEIRRLCEICLPDVGVITNIGEAHLEFLGSLEAVAAAKAEMLPFLTGEKVTILNLDDPYLNGLLPAVRGRLLTFGFSTGADLQATEVTLEAQGTTFVLRRGQEQERVRLPIVGYHNVVNAAAAAAVGTVSGLSLPTIARGLASITEVPMRMQMVRLTSGGTLLNDAYNANPSSMRAAITTFFEMRTGGKAILILGDMLELGAASPAAHREIGEFLAPFAPDLLLTVGSASHTIGQAAVACGMERARVHHCPDHGEARALLQAHLGPESWVLLKGSRGMRLEKIVEGL